MKGLIISIMFLLCLSSIVALDNLGTFNQGEKVRITQVCSDATYINITSISYPNSTINESNIRMSSNIAGEFYYNFNDTKVLGRYDVRGISDGCEQTFATYFIIDNNTFMIFIILLSIASFLLIMSIFGNTEFFLFSSGALFISNAILTMIYGIGTLSNMYTRIIAFVILGLGIILVIGAYLDFGTFGNRTQGDED